MVELFANNAHGLFNAGISAVATSLTLQAGQGASFPNPGSGEFFRVTLVRVDLTAYEIVFCTARSGDVLTIQRAKEGTTAVTFSTADRVRHTPTAGMFDSLGGAVDVEAPSLLTGWGGPGTGFGSDWGLDLTNTGGTQTNSGVAATNQQTSLPGVVNTSTIGSQFLGFGAGTTRSRVHRGDAANRGGFDVWQAFAIVADISGTFAFWGADGANAATYAGGTPEGRTAVEQFGIGFASSSAPGSNLFLYHNAGTGGPVTAIDTGFARNTTDVFLLRWYATPNASNIKVTLYNLATGGVFTATISTNMPAQTTFLVFRFTMSGAVGGAIKTFGIWRFNVNQGEAIA